MEKATRQSCGRSGAGIDITGEELHLRAWFAANPQTQPLDAKPMVEAFRRWDQEIGAQKTK